MERVEISCSDGVLRALLPKEIDHHAAEAVRKAIDSTVSERGVKKLILDFSNVEFADSSAVGLLLGRYKLMEEKGGEVEAVNLTGQCKKLLELSGIRELIPIKEKTI